jgi:HlyD family secretion protein
VIKTSRRTLAWAGTAIIVLAIVGYILKPAAVDIDFGVVTAGPLRVTIDEDGRTRVRDRYLVTAPVAGRLQRIALHEGNLVRRRDIVAWKAPLPLDATTRELMTARILSAEALYREAGVRVNAARTAAAQAKKDADRRTALLGVGGIAPAQHEQAVLAERAARDDLAAAESRERAAAAEVRGARAALTPVTSAGLQTSVPVRSPTAGRVLRIPDQSERVIAAGSPILELGDASALEVVVDVLSTDAVRLHPGDEVDIVEWGGDQPIRGTVRTIEPSAFTKVSALGVDEQRVNVLIDLPQRPESLGDGFRVEARMTVWEAPKVITAPSSSVFQRGESWKVFVIDGGRAHLRPVQIGHRTDASVEIVSGLTPGTKVVLFPSDKIGDGVRVRPRQIAD